MDHDEEHPFYGYTIIPRNEKEIIENLLSKYRNEPVNDELKKKIWDDLQRAKYEGKITIPFKVVIRKDPQKKFFDYVEIILDTKV